MFGTSRVGVVLDASIGRRMDVVGGASTGFGEGWEGDDDLVSGARNNVAFFCFTLSTHSYRIN